MGLGWGGVGYVSNHVKFAHALDATLTMGLGWGWGMLAFMWSCTRTWCYADDSKPVRKKNRGSYSDRTEHHFTWENNRKHMTFYRFKVSFSTCMPKIHISLKRNSRNCFEFTTVAARNKGQLVVLADENAQKHGVLVWLNENELEKTINPAGLLQAPPPCFNHAMHGIEASLNSIWRPVLKWFTPKAASSPLLLETQHHHWSKKWDLQVACGPSLFCYLGFPRIGVPPVIIHFRLGFIHNKNHPNVAIPPFMETPAI